MVVSSTVLAGHPCSPIFASFVFASSSSCSGLLIRSWQSHSELGKVISEHQNIFGVTLIRFEVNKVQTNSNERGVVMLTPALSFSSHIYYRFRYQSQHLLTCEAKRRLDRMRSNVHSMSKWPVSLWRLDNTRDYRSSGRTSCNCTSSPSCPFLYRISSLNSRRLYSRSNSGSSGSSNLAMGGTCSPVSSGYNFFK